MNVLFWVPYPSDGPSNRYRIEQYLPYLEESGIGYSLRPFWSPAAFKALYKSGHNLLKFHFFILGTIRRILDLFTLFLYDVIFIHREAYPLGGAFFESIVVFLGKPMIFDFDDAIFLSFISKSNSFIERFKDFSKIKYIIGKSRYVIAGNSYLYDFASKYNPSTFLIPTAINTAQYSPDEQRLSSMDKREIVIGWIGSVTTLDFLANLRNVFKVLTERYQNLKIKVVGGKFLSDTNINIISKEWAFDEEKDDLKGFDIGIMPMPDNEWSKGKCGFKAILYMSMAIPCVSSSVGVAKEIIIDGENGFLADTEDEWIKKLSRLIEDAELRKKMGLSGRRLVEEKFSICANAPKFLELILKASRSGRR